LDLVGRKMPAHAGRYLRSVFHPISEHIAAKKADPALGEFITPLEKAFIRLQQATTFVAQKGMARPDEAGAAASDYLRLFGLTVLAYLWAKMAEDSLAKAGQDGFYRAKIGTARFFMERLLPQTGALLQAITSGAKTMMAFEDAAF
uniref:acyl-CoA dehydrogenase C-terminal domain-containing protein n=1 Tax=Rhodoblastus sp. TaxID=1962975 RepID=UPI003F9758B4